MRARNSSYSSPSAPIGRRLEKVTEGSVGASVLISMLLSLSGENQ